MGPFQNLWHAQALPSADGVHKVLRAHLAFFQLDYYSELCCYRPNFHDFLLGWHLLVHQAPGLISWWAASAAELLLFLDPVFLIHDSSDIAGVDVVVKVQCSKVTFLANPVVHYSTGTRPGNAAASLLAGYV